MRVCIHKKLFRLKTLNLADNNLKAFEVDSNLKPKKLEKAQTKIGVLIL